MGCPLKEEEEPCKDGFSMSLSWSFLVFNNLRKEAVVDLVDIGGIVDHHCLNIYAMVVMFVEKIGLF